VVGIAEAASGLLALAAVAGTGYQLAAAHLLARFVARQPAPPVTTPPVTLLKPLCGAEPGLEACLRSFCDQPYPHLQIVFGVHDEADGALPVVRQLQAEYKDLDITVVVGQGRPEGGNPKVANLLDMMPAARHDVLVLSDSDMKVSPDYLSAIVATLEQPGVGIATCLYVGHAGEGTWSRLGAMGINHGFLPSVMVAEAIGRTDGCFGATIALTRSMLEAIGGFELLREQLADDYLLGEAVRERGQSIGLIPNLPRSMVHEPGFGSMFDHEVRWGRTLASIDRVGYVASMVTLTVPLAVISVAISACAAAGGAVALGALALALAGRWWAVRSQERSLGLDGGTPLLILVRDLLSFAVQIVALSGRTVQWRGRQFRIGRRGNLVPFGESR
jgi:ceramide glucosyltransferase